MFPTFKASVSPPDRHHGFSCVTNTHLSPRTQYNCVGSFFEQEPKHNNIHTFFCLPNCWILAMSSTEKDGETSLLIREMLLAISMVLWNKRGNIPIKVHNRSFPLWFVCHKIILANTLLHYTPNRMQSKSSINETKFTVWYNICTNQQNTKQTAITNANYSKKKA